MWRICSEQLALERLLFVEAVAMRVNLVPERTFWYEVVRLSQYVCLERQHGIVYCALEHDRWKWAYQGL